MPLAAAGGNTASTIRKALCVFLATRSKSNLCKKYVVCAKFQQNIDKLLILKHTFKSDYIFMQQSAMNLDLALQLLLKFAMRNALLVNGLTCKSPVSLLLTHLVTFRKPALRKFRCTLPSTLRLR